MTHMCQNPYGSLQPRSVGVNVDLYRRTIIDATVETGDFFSPGKSNVRFRSCAAAAAAEVASGAAAAAPVAAAGDGGATTASQDRHVTRSMVGKFDEVATA